MKPARWHLHRGALLAYRRLPTRARRAVVRAVAPTYSAGALAVIERDDGAILLIRQVYRRDWGLPGGLVKRLEAPADAAVREVREEVGLQIEIVGRGALVADLAPRRLDFVYPARLVAGGDGVSGAGAERDVVRPVSPELRAAAWFPRDGLPAVQFETRTALEALSADGQLPFVVASYTPADRETMN